MSDEKTLHCACGCDRYHLRFTFDGKRWIECVECGRPSGVVGIGEQKQREWQDGDSE